MSARQRFTKYIVIRQGMPYTADELPATYSHLKRSDVIRNVWRSEHAFNETSHYRCVIDEKPRFNRLQRFLACMIYDPQVQVALRWQRVGDYSQKSLVAEVKRGLQSDDDIIQQWFGGDDILALLNAAQSWQEMLLAVEAIGGGAEIFPDVRNYVERVLR